MDLKEIREAGVPSTTEGAIRQSNGDPRFSESIRARLNRLPDGAFGDQLGPYVLFGVRADGFPSSVNLMDPNTICEDAEGEHDLVLLVDSLKEENIRRLFPGRLRSREIYEAATAMAVPVRHMPARLATRVRNASCGSGKTATPQNGDDFLWQKPESDPDPDQLEFEFTKDMEHMERERDKDTGSLPDTGDRSQFETGAQRDAMRGKGLPHLIPPQAIRRLAKRFEDGAIKYDKNNWLKGIPLHRFVDAIIRHTLAEAEGDTSEDHLAAVMWNAAAMMETQDRIEQGRLPGALDDLPYAEDYEGEAIRRLAKRFERGCS